MKKISRRHFGKIVSSLGVASAFGMPSLVLGASRKVVVIEQDERCIQVLHELKISYPDRLTIISGDALKIDPEPFLKKPVKVIANLPYNIGTVAFDIFWSDHSSHFVVRSCFDTFSNLLPLYCLSMNFIIGVESTWWAPFSSVKTGTLPQSSANETAFLIFNPLTEIRSTSKCKYSMSPLTFQQNGQVCNICSVAFDMNWPIIGHYSILVCRIGYRFPTSFPKFKIIKPS